MKRPMLISGITMLIAAAPLMIFSTEGAIVMLLTGALAFVLYLIKPLKLRRFIIIPAIALATIMVSTSFLTYTNLRIQPALTHDNTTAYLSGKVISTPVNANGYISFVLKTEKIGDTDQSLKIDVVLPATDNDCPELYDYISINEAHLQVNRNENLQYDLSGAADGILLFASGDKAEILWQCERTPYYYCLRFRELVSNQIDDYMLQEYSGILKGLMFGGSTNVPSEVAKAFRSSGVSHLLAVSGLHTSLWCGLIIFLFKLLHIPTKIRNVFCVIFLLCFCTITGFTPSVLRSSLMSLLLFSAPFARTEPDSLNSLGFAGSVLILSNPYVVFNLSFQLSLCATLGVLLVAHYESRIRKAFRRIKIRPLRAILNYAVCSFLLSAGAGLFTMPVSAFNFGTLSVCAPITNILSVKPAFYAMICGTIATATSYIKLGIVQKLTIFLYNICELLLKIVTEITTKISGFTYCTIPVHKGWLLNALFIGCLIIAFGYIIYKLKSNKKIIEITAVTAVVVIFINIFIPILPTPFRDTVTVVSSGNNINLIIRSGTHYAYIVNSDTTYPSSVYNYLPKATCESLDYWLVTYATYDTSADLERLPYNITPKEIVITPYIKKICLTKSIPLPQNTIISSQGSYTLNNQINFEIIDTYSAKYVIIRGNDKKVFVHLHGSSDLADFVDVSEGDVFIFNGKIPDDIPASAQQIIISGTADFINNEKYNKFITMGESVHLTALEGDVKINI